MLEQFPVEGDVDIDLGSKLGHGSAECLVNVRVAHVGHSPRLPAASTAARRLAIREQHAERQICAPASRYEGPTTVGCDPSLDLVRRFPRVVTLTHPVTGAAAARS